MKVQNYIITKLVLTEDEYKTLMEASEILFQIHSTLDYDEHTSILAGDAKQNIEDICKVVKIESNTEKNQERNDKS